MSIKRTTFENYTLLLANIDDMKLKPFSVKSIIRFIRPFCKTFRVSDTLFYMRIRGCKNGLTISLDTDFEIASVANNVKLINATATYNFHITTGKDFLKKLIKHNLLKP